MNSQNDILIPSIIEGKLFGAAARNSVNMVKILAADITPRTFGDPVYGAFFKIAREQYNEVGSFDMSTILQATASNSFFGGYDPAVVEQLLRQATENTNPYDIDKYIQPIKDHARRRHFRAKGNEMAAAAEDLTRPLTEIAQEAEAAILAATSATLRPARKHLSTAERLLANFDNPADVRGMTTGFSKIDLLTGGLGVACLWVIFGYSGVGKSTWVQQALLHFCTQCEGDERIAVVPTEMTVEEWRDRLVAFKLGVSYDLLQSGFLERAHVFQHEERGFIRAMLAEACEYVDGLPIDWIEFENRNPNGLDLITKARTGKYKLFLVDGLADMSSVDPKITYDEFRMTTANMQLLHLLYKQYQLPVIFTHQINQKVGDRAVKKPTPFDLRGSGRINQLVTGSAAIWNEAQIEDLTGVSQSDSAIKRIIFHFYKWRSKGIAGSYVELKQYTDGGQQGFVEGDVHVVQRKTLKPNETVHRVNLKDFT